MENVSRSAPSQYDHCYFPTGEEGSEAPLTFRFLSTEISFPIKIMSHWQHAAWIVILLTSEEPLNGTLPVLEPAKCRV